VAEWGRRNLFPKRERGIGSAGSMPRQAGAADGGAGRRTPQGARRHEWRALRQGSAPGPPAAGRHSMLCPYRRPRAGLKGRRYKSKGEEPAGRRRYGRLAVPGDAALPGRGRDGRGPFDCAQDDFSLCFGGRYRQDFVNAVSKFTYSLGFSLSAWRPIQCINPF